MLSKKKTRLLDSFSFRLTAWYTAFFSLSLLIIFFISYKILVSGLMHVTDRSLMAEAVKIEDEFSKGGLGHVEAAIRENIEEEGKNRVFYRLLSSHLDVLATSDPLKWPCLNFPQMSRWASMAAAGPVYSSLSPPDRDYRIRILSKDLLNGQYILQIGKTTKDEEGLVRLYQKVFGASVAVLLACGVILAWMEAQRAMGRIEQLMQELKDVTDNIAHDLRTPITRIRGLAEVEQHESSGMVVEECDRLVQMINTMLEIAKADAGLKHSDNEAVEMVSLIQKGCSIFESAAQDKGLALHFKSDLPSLKVTGQPVRLQRVVSNLLDNAIKFTPSGGTIVVGLTKIGREAVICVEDTGIGIEPAFQARIFEKFYRIESSRSTPGHGLGLSYVQSMVSAMGGTVTVESAPGAGSRFVVRLPL